MTSLQKYQKLSVAEIEDYKTEIARLHAEVFRLAETSRERAIRIGELLTKIKASMPVGTWIDWLQENVGFHLTTCQRYMRVYDRRNTLDPEMVSFTKVIKSLTIPKEPKPEEPPPPPDDPPHIRTATEEIDNLQAPIPAEQAVHQEILNREAQEQKLKAIQEEEQVLTSPPAFELQAEKPITLEQKFQDLYDWIIGDLKQHPDHDVEVFRRLAQTSARLRDAMTHIRAKK